MSTDANRLRTTEEWDAIEAEVYARGREDGYAAATWYFDGNSEREEYERTLRGIIEGDPVIYDTFPSSPLSGEYADGLLPRDVLEGVGVSEDDDHADGLLAMYEDGYGVAVSHEIERAARAVLGDVDTCEKCDALATLYHNDATGMALCVTCDYEAGPEPEPEPEPERTEQDAARDALRYFVCKASEKRGSFWTLRDDRPEWVLEMVRSAHGVMLPDDHIYNLVQSALCHIAERDDWEDSIDEWTNDQADIYTSDLTDWLASHVARLGWTDEARDEWGDRSDSILTDMQRGQIMEARDVFGIVESELRATL